MAYTQQEDSNSSQIESFLNHLIQNHLIDNSEDSETLSKFLNLYDQFEDQQQQQQNDNNSSINDYDQNNDSQVMFETRAIFTLADFLKALSANEYYDIAQKVYNQWFDQETKKHYKVLERLVKTYEKFNFSKMHQGFAKWKQIKEFQDILEENERLREYIHQLTRENDSLSQERNILELQTKKRNQISVNQIPHIRPLRQNRKTANSTYRSSSRQMSQSMRGPIHESQDPIHDRLHREAYQKSQQQVINDLIKQQDELKDCTFKPNMSMIPPAYNNNINTPLHLSSARGVRREDPFLYERLSKSTKKFNPELLQLQKENEEMKDCTFKPQTNARSRQIAEKIQTDYSDKDQFYERLHKEAESKDKFKKSLQMLKDQAEVNQCTFQPEVNSNRNQSILSSAQKIRTEPHQEDPFQRLHHQHEDRQRSLVKKECEYDQKFKESHPFHPIRVTKQQDPQRNENSQQRAARLYEEWKEKERKIQEKRNELQKEEEKLCKLTLVSQKQKNKRKSIDQSQSFNSGLSPRSSHQPQQNFNMTNESSSVNQSNHSINTAQNPHDRLYNHGKDKQRKQEELRDKVYRESGFSFAPQTNPSSHKFQSIQEKTVIDRNKEFIQKRDTHIKEIAQQNACDFKPQRVTTKSKLAKNYERQNEDNQENLCEKLYQKGAQIEQKKEKQRQELAVDRNCTFKPQLAKKTEKILRESSAQRNGTQLSNQSRSTASLGSHKDIETKQPFINRTNNNFSQNLYH